MGVKQATCKHGHPLDEANTYLYPIRNEDGVIVRQMRQCRACRHQRGVAAWQAKLAEREQIAT